MRPLRSAECRFCMADVNPDAVKCARCGSRLKGLEAWRIILIVVVCAAIGFFFARVA